MASSDISQDIYWCKICCHCFLASSHFLKVGCIKTFKARQTESVRAPHYFFMIPSSHCNFLSAVGFTVYVLKKSTCMTLRTSIIYFQSCCVTKKTPAKQNKNKKTTKKPPVRTKPRKKLLNKGI